MTETDRTLVITRQSAPGGPVVLRVDGELDHHTAPRLREALVEVPYPPGGGVVLDLSGLAYCDSTGITVIITAHHRAAAASCVLSVAGLGPHLRRMFQIAGIDRVIPFHATTEDALDALDGSGRQREERGDRVRQGRQGG